jgi:uncharacterized repeat protein (TIGR03803 family)
MVTHHPLHGSGPCGRLRRTRGRCGSLILHRMTLSFTTPRRFDRRTRRKHMQTGRRSAWCMALATLYLLPYSTPGLAQESSSTDTSSAQTLTTIHNFNGTDGYLPFAALTQATDVNLYGTTYYGGASGSGNLFKVTTAGRLKTAYSFCSESDCADGEYTYAVPVQGTDGDFCGTAYLGGANDQGTVFKLSPSGTLTTLHSFDGTDAPSLWWGWFKPPMGPSTEQRTWADLRAMDRSSESLPAVSSPYCTAFAPRVVARTAKTPSRR